MIKSTAVFFLLFLLLLLSSFLIANEIPKNLLKVSSVDLDLLPSSQMKRELGDSTTLQLLIRVDPQVHTDREKQIQIEKIAGHSLGTFLSQDTYVIKASLDAIDLLRKNQFVKWVGQYKAQHKFVQNDGISSFEFSELLAENGAKNKAAAFETVLGEKTIQVQNKQNNAQQALESLMEADMGAQPKRKVPEIAHTAADGRKFLVFKVLLEKSKPLRFNSDGELLQLNDAQITSLNQQTNLELNSMIQQGGYEMFSSAVYSNDKIHVSVAANEDSINVAKLLSRHQDVHYVELAPVNVMHNSWAKMITQTAPNSFGQFYPKSVNPIKTAGLTGQGQVVGVADSGLDTGSCYFYDPVNPVPHVNEPKPITTSKHRKVQGVWNLIDENAEDNAHGTHVTGTVLGKSALNNAELAQHNGMAEDAKVLFADIGCTTPGGCKCQGVPCDCDIYPEGKCPNSDRAVYLPADLNLHFFPWFYESGVRIQTNSWGGGSGLLGYSLSSKEIDEFTWKHKDFLVLFSAGNSGDEYGYVSLGSQAEAKNALSVGASVNSVDMFKFYVNKVLDFDARTKQAAMLLSLLVCDDQSCFPNPNATAICDFFKNNFTTSEDCCSQKGFCAPAPGQTTCGCAQNNIGNYCCKKCFVDNYNSNPQNERNYNPQNLAYFSSRGPAVDGRLKPEVVAPGHSLISAKSYNTVEHPRTCDMSASSVKIGEHVTSMGGTSMSCPATAGSAALVRQFFTEGYWYQGKQEAAHGFVPSSALLRAVLIASGEKLQGALSLYNSLYKIHGDQEIAFNTKMLEGFGLINLPRVLTFEQTTDAAQSKILIGRSGTENNEDPALTTGQKHKYCVKVGTKSSYNLPPLKFTLAWTDAPGSPATQAALVNNLDLAVKGADGDTYWGNVGAKNSRYVRDTINNVEQVAFSDSPAGRYVVVVDAINVPVGPQPYSLVITGDAQFTECTSADLIVTETGSNTDNNNQGTTPAALPSGVVFLLAGMFVLIILLVVITVIVATVAYLIFKRMQHVAEFAKHMRPTDVMPLREESENL